MLHRREFLKSSIGVGMVALAGDCFAAPATDRIRAAVEQTVGAREKVTGMVAVAIDETGTSRVVYGSSGVPKLVLDGTSVFEMM